MNDNSRSIWGTLEIYCVSADMDYEKDYLVLHAKENTTGKALSKEGFQKVKELFNIEFENDMKYKEKTG